MKEVTRRREGSWDEAVSEFVKVMPLEYKAAPERLAEDNQTPAHVAA